MLAKEISFQYVVVIKYLESFIVAVIHVGLLRELSGTSVKLLNSMIISREIGARNGKVTSMSLPVAAMDSESLSRILNTSEMLGHSFSVSEKLVPVLYTEKGLHCTDLGLFISQHCFDGLAGIAGISVMLVLQSNVSSNKSANGDMYSSSSGFYVK